MRRSTLVAILGAALLSTGCDAVTSLLDQGGIADDVANPATGFSSLYNGYLSQCASCHAPGAPGYTSNIEKTLDFSSESAARSSLLNGSASGLEGNGQDCNGVAFVGETYDQSLLAAVLDQAVRSSIALGAGGACNGDTISDMTVKAGEPPAGFLGDLKSWINGGAML